MTDRELDMLLLRFCKSELKSLKDQTCFMAEIWKHSIRFYEKVLREGVDVAG